MKLYTCHGDHMHTSLHIIDFEYVNGWRKRSTLSKATIPIKWFSTLAKIVAYHLWSNLLYPIIKLLIDDQNYLHSIFSE